MRLSGLLFCKIMWSQKFARTIRLISKLWDLKIFSLFFFRKLLEKKRKMDLENGLIDIKNLTCLDISYPKNYFLKITDMHGIGNISPTLIFLQIRDL